MYPGDTAVRVAAQFPHGQLHWPLSYGILEVLLAVVEGAQLWQSAMSSQSYPPMHYNVHNHCPKCMTDLLSVEHHYLEPGPHYTTHNTSKGPEVMSTCSLTIELLMHCASTAHAHRIRLYQFAVLVQYVFMIDLCIGGGGHFPLPTVSRCTLLTQLQVVLILSCTQV